ncbi:hypothetical protein TDB9533_01209 [Thalassocella blandensis]|nr:hypothetical protein TDB9533_01209 [Thalassocella blandensis]
MTIDWFQIFKIVYFLIGHLDEVVAIILTILGWFIIVQNGKRLARKNEAHNLFQITRSLVNNIFETSKHAWLKGKIDLPQIEEHHLMLMCAELEICISKLNNYFDTKIYSQQITDLRQAITLIPFTINGKKLDCHSRIQEINSISSEINALLITGVYTHLNKS